MTENMMQTLTEIEGTTQTLTRLEFEHADLSKRMSDAANDADSASLITLAHRRNDLPIEILSARIRLERLLLLRDEQRLPLLQTEVAKLAEPIEGMLKKIAEMHREFNIKSGEVGSITEDIRQLKMEIAERKRQIASLVHEARNVKISPASLQAHGGI
jgi:peptidoglycan hydrolase CwlO-like protein